MTANQKLKPQSKIQKREFKGLYIPKEIFFDKALSWQEKILFSEIYSFTVNKKECWISNEFICSFLNVTERTARRIIRKLIKGEYIIQTRFNGKHRFLKAKFTPEKDPARTPVSGQGGHPCPGRPDKNVLPGEFHQYMTRLINTTSTIYPQKVKDLSPEEFIKLFFKDIWGRKAVGEDIILFSELMKDFKPEEIYYSFQEAHKSNAKNYRYVKKVLSNINKKKEIDAAKIKENQSKIKKQKEDNELKASDPNSPALKELRLLIQDLKRKGI